VRAWLLLAAGAVVYAVAVVWSAAQVPPDGVPLHFDGSGLPTRWGTREEAVGSWAAAGGVVAAVAAAALLLVRRLPVRAINVPHREYWAAPERQHRFRRMIGRDVAVLLGVTLALLGLIPVGTVLATRSDPVELPAVLLLPLIGYGVGVLVWGIVVLRHRYRPDQDR
jgi:uncharacterized membrane protein